jgi:hypothetical protein
MSHDTSALNGLLRSFERCNHTAFADETFSSLINPTSFLTSFTCFGPRRHDLFYTNKPTAKKNTISSEAEKSLNRVSHLNEDVQDYVLLTMFSQQTLQSPVSHFSLDRRLFLQIRKLSKSTSNKNSGSTPKPVTKQPKMTDNQITNLALRSALLFGKKTTPTFSQLFPETTWPQITFVQGHPRINRDTFNSLLLSKVRAIKSKVVSSGAPAPKSLSKNLILRISRMIDLSLSIEYTQRSTLHQQAKVSTIKKVKAKAKTQLAARFAKEAPSTATSSKAPPAPEEPAPSPQDLESPPLDFTPSSSSSLQPWIQFLDGQDFTYLGPSEAQSLLTVHRKIAMISEQVINTPEFSPGPSYRRLTLLECNALENFDVRHLFAFVSSSWLTTASQMQPLLAISKIDEFRHQLVTAFRTDDLTFNLEMKIRSSPLFKDFATQTPPLSDIINDDVLNFYRKPLAAHSEFFDDAICVLESSVLTLRDLF